MPEGFRPGWHLSVTSIGGGGTGFRSLGYNAQQDKREYTKGPVWLPPPGSAGTGALSTPHAARIVPHRHWLGNNI
jgi:hypothetical protein